MNHSIIKHDRLHKESVKREYHLAFGQVSVSWMGTGVGGQAFIKRNDQ